MNENKIAWIITFACVGLMVAMIALIGMRSPGGSGLNSGQNSGPAASAYARLFQERNRLQARVNYCERQAEGDTPAYRRACNEDEIAKLDEYRKRVAQIDAELKQLRASTGPAQ
ncbi:MAG: hypothetical protein NXI24_24970 [bacterium]|nr:hypothetical protein [bacterium]